MFARLAVLALLALPFLAAAIPADPSARSGSGTYCCNSVAASSSKEGASILDTLPIDVGSLTGLVGLTCSPITVIGVASGDACSGTTVNCNTGGVGLGCIPVVL
ncbi:putative hydrophin-like protein [Phlebiopsis gigantea 11061_1 CR5-6]|uniref:Hydrophobin n=1 Tax=Phlebiopsis gigantea (strain 11061_1 CR5-6) TaxID=745531 RepID=A0A0C3RQ52_PHLG1|nr:putative hydrophin-like protein [Phlebiopsis gigantea 11061_1 CR5-6]